MSEKGSKPVCWLCKQRVGLVIEWVLLDPSVVPPPAGIHVCGPDCPKQPEGAVIVRHKEILANVAPLIGKVLEAEGEQMTLPGEAA